MSKKKKRHKKTSLLSVIITLTVVSVICAGIISKRAEAAHTRDLYTAKEEALLKEKEYEERRQAVLTKYEMYVNSFQFIEDTAREKFGLVYPDEIVIKAEKSGGQ